MVTAQNLYFCKPNKKQILDLWLNWIEHLTTDQEVRGSNPFRFTFNKQLSLFVKHYKKAFKFNYTLMLNIVLFGPPGAGKGTQSQNLIEQYGLIHLSTGDILRNEIAHNTTLGVEAKKLMDQGLLVPDEVVIGMISNKLDANKDAKGFIFDGFPRTVAQAEALDNLLISKNSSIAAMVALEVNELELEKRLLLRGKDSGRIDDQNPEIIKKRIVEYVSKTAIVASFYASQNKYYSVNGIGNINVVFADIKKVLDTLVN